MTVEHRFETFTSSSRRPRPVDEAETSWRSNISYISYRVAHQWSNVYGLKYHWNRGYFTYIVTTVTIGAVGAQLTLNLSPWTKLRTLWFRRFILLKAKTFLYFDDSQAARWRWELRPATTLLDFSDLNEILLKNMINNIKTVALSRTWKAITNPISFISLSYHQTDNQCIIWNPSSWKLHSLVFYNYQ